MTEATTAERESCDACGVDVRPQADYCYNCGGAVSASAIARKTSAATENGTIEKPEIETPSTENKQNTDEQAKLRTAASLRRKSKITERQTVEVVWEENDRTPNGWFILAALFLTLLAAGILLLANYLK